MDFGPNRGNRTFRPLDVSLPGRFAPDCGRFAPVCFSMCLLFFRTSERGGQVNMGGQTELLSISRISVVTRNKN